MAGLFALSLFAAACGDDDDGGDDAGATTTAAEGDGGGDLATGPGFDGTTIRLGVVTPQTGGVEVIGNPLTNGNRVFFDAINAQGGIAGQYPVELVVVDSQYNADTAAQQYNAIKDDVVMFTQLLGTPIVDRLLPDLERDGIVAAPASLDAFWVREPNLLPIGAPYQVQAINAMSWYVTEGGGEGQTICFAGHDDPYGDAGLEGLEVAAEAEGFEIAAEVRFGATSPAAQLAAPMQQLQQAGCEAIFLTATPSTAGGIMGAAAQAQYAPQWIGQSPTYISAFLASPAAPYFQANYLVASEGSEWGDPEIPGMVQMLEDVAEFAPDQQPDPYFVFGYVEAWSVAQVLEAAVENGDLSREGIIEAMESIDQLEFDGLFGTYPYGAPEDRDPPRETSIFAVDPAAPGGLRLQERGIEVQAATDYEFPEG
jgi:ABC-type branched-subunit amino acid transport system substrate-binding protein